MFESGRHNANREFGVVAKRAKAVAASSRLPMTQAMLPARAGVGLKPQHFQEILEARPDVGFFEVHAENFMVEGGPLLHFLERIRRDYALSLHGVALSIGGEEPLDEAHLNRLHALIERYEPSSFSEHLAWSSHNGIFLNDLLPLAYDQPTLDRVCDHVDQVQNRLRRTMLLENPSTYFGLATSTLTEGQFVSEVVSRTGCGLLLDVNNVYVSAVNGGQDPASLLEQLPLARACEIHLAGFVADANASGARVLIDNHGAAVDDAVWALYEQAISRRGAVPTLIERDHDIPALSVLVAEASRAESTMAALGMPDQIPTRFAA